MMILCMNSLNFTVGVVNLCTRKCGYDFKNATLYMLVWLASKNKYDDNLIIYTHPQKGSGELGLNP